VVVVVYFVLLQKHFTQPKQFQWKEKTLERKKVQCSSSHMHHQD